MKQISRELYWRKIVEDFIQSGMAPKDFCLKRHLSVKTFYKWRKWLASTSTAKVDNHETLKLIPIELKTSCNGGNPESGQSSGVHLGFGGLNISIDRGFDAGTLERVLSLLKEDMPC